jgi:light-independent protochlorophyllide reductase subunit B
VKLAVWAYQAPAHVGVSRAASSFAGVHTIVRAPKGDGYSTIMLAMFERLGVPPPLTFAAMTEATLAGEAADIGSAIRDVDERFAPRAIVITRSGTAAVLQEPLDGEIAMMPAGSVRADIIQASTHPVRDTEVSAFAKTVRQIVETYAEDGHRRTREPSVNIVGPSLLGFHDRSNIESLRRLFADLGVTVNAVVPLGASPDDLRTLGRAWLNVPTAYELALPTLQLLRERFETPFVSDVPYGEAGTTRVVNEIARILEIPRARIAHAARDAMLGWYARTVDAHALSGKRVGVFGAPSAAAGIARVLREELDMQVEFCGTYVTDHGAWLRERVADLGCEVLLTDDYREVAALIDRTRPDIVFGSQMERHSASRFGVPCAVISPPAHILNFPLGYEPFVGYDGANHLGDLVNRTQVLGLEHHLIETFGPRNQGRFAEAAPEGVEEPAPPVAAAGSNGAAAAAGPRWDASAERLLGRIPFFVRKKARTNVETYARERGVALIDEATVLAAREHVGG